jgi:DNA-binding CsgD family transcriptional regulator
MAIGPLLAAAFESVWEDSLRRQEHDTLSAVCSNRGYVTLLVRKDGVLVSPNERALASLRSLCGRFRTEGLPRPFAKVLRRLLRELLADQAVPLAFREVDVEGKRCCLFVAPAPMGLKEAILYRVFIVCPSGLLDTALFSGAGFTENELKVLELLRRNALVTEISQTLGVTEDLAKYYIKRLGKKLGATGGKGQIIERASGKSRELAVKEGLLECALGEVQEDRRGETQRRRRRSVQ